MKTFNRFSLLCLFLAITALAASTPVALLLHRARLKPKILNPKKSFLLFRPRRTSWTR